jgi:hypothetical protein
MAAAHYDVLFAGLIFCKNTAAERRGRDTPAPKKSIAAGALPQHAG